MHAPVSYQINLPPGDFLVHDPGDIYPRFADHIAAKFEKYFRIRQRLVKFFQQSPKPIANDFQIQRGIAREIRDAKAAANVDRLWDAREMLSG